MITAAPEKFADCLEELRPWLPLHWKELALFQDRMPLDPMFEIYLAREAAGELAMVVLRADGRMIGYYIGFVAPGLHYKTTLTFTTDIFYIAPEHRGRGNGDLLLGALERELKRRGVKLAYVGSKNHKPSEFLFTANGYEPCETLFCKWIGDDHGA